MSELVWMLIDMLDLCTKLLYGWARMLLGLKA